MQQRAVDGRTLVRGVLRDGPVGNARAADSITLEEAYLAFMVGRGRHVEELDLSDAGSDGSIA